VRRIKAVSRTLWSGRPWVLPAILTRGIAVIVVTVLAFWLEFFFGVAYFPAPIMPVTAWTSLALFTAWIASIIRSLLLRASNSYVLMNDGLEVRVGIVTSKSFVVTPAGFSDLEVSRSLSARIVNSGDIVIHTQGESDIRMERVRNSLKVAAQIREVMARPFVRIEKSVPLNRQVNHPAEDLSK
jgi:uncharacterized membrane protein YdbT with pleckstrin-like domain